jgi:hypothetical protein
MYVNGLQNLGLLNGLQNLGLLRAARLKNVKMKMIGVNDNTPCKSVCDLSPKTINPTGMVPFSLHYKFFA